MTTTRQKIKPNEQMCGWCSGAARSERGVAWSHGRCYSTDQAPCACAANGHRLTPTLAEAMARYTHITVDAVYAAHDRKRRVLTDEQRSVNGARLQAALAAARARKAEAVDVEL